MTPQELADRLNELCRISGQPEKYKPWSAETFARTFDVEFRQAPVKEGGARRGNKVLLAIDLYRSGLWHALTGSRSLFEALRAAEDD